VIGVAWPRVVDPVLEDMPGMMIGLEQTFAQNPDQARGQKTELETAIVR